MEKTLNHDIILETVHADRPSTKWQIILICNLSAYVFHTTLIMGPHMLLGHNSKEEEKEEEEEEEEEEKDQNPVLPVVPI